MPPWWQLSWGAAGNEKLDEVGKARLSLEELAHRRPLIAQDDLEKLHSLGERFEQVWNHAACPVELKKKIVRTIVEEIVVNEPSEGHLQFVIRWKGGTHTAFEMTKPRSATAQKTAEDDLEIIRKMSTRHGDDEIASVLNRLGRRTGKGMSWNRVAVKSARRNYSIPGHSRTAKDQDILSMQAAEQYLGVSNTTIERLVKTGLLPMKQVVPFAPWEIQRSDLDSPAVQRQVAHLKKTGRLQLKRGPSSQQGKLFE